MDLDMTIWLLIAIVGWLLYKQISRPRTYQDRYRRMLRDPRWAMRRRAYFETHDYVCSQCSSHHRLQLHHKFYLYGRPPWDYPDNALEPLCGRCHKRRHGIS